MDKQLTMPFLRINDITEMSQSLGMYESLEIWKNEKTNVYTLVERTYDPQGVSRVPRMSNLTTDELTHCYSIGLYNR